MLAVMSITYFFVADVKCGLCEINKNSRADATHGLSPVRKMFRGQTEVIVLSHSACWPNGLRALAGLSSTPGLEGRFSA